MSEISKFVQEVKPVYVDATGRVIRAPFINIPMTELQGEEDGANIVDRANIFINGLDLYDEATEDLYITGYATSLTDGTDFSNLVNAGITVELQYTLAAVNYFPIFDQYTFGDKPAFAHIAGYSAYRSRRFNPLIKVPVNATFCRLMLYNYTGLNINGMGLYVFYFALPYAT